MSASFPLRVAFRNELLRSGHELPEVQNQQDLDAAAEKYKAQAKRLRKFAVWVAIDKRGREFELEPGHWALQVLGM